MRKCIIGRYAVICLVYLFVLSACQESHDIISEDVLSGDDIVRSVNLDCKSILSYTAFINGTIIYKCVNDNSVDFYETTAAGETLKLGSVSNFYLSAKQSVLDYPNLYFFVSTIDDGVISNPLMRINLETHKMDSFAKDDNSIPGLSTYLFGEHVVTFKNIVSASTINTYIESIDVEDNEWKKYMESSMDKTTNCGTAVYGLCANSQNLFVLYDVCEDVGKIDTYLVVLDNNYQKITSIKIGKQMHDYVMTSHISDVQAFDDYIYIYNASNYGYLARIDDDELVEVYKERNFDIASDPSSTKPIFYIRKTNQVFLLNSNGTLNKIELHVENGYVIRTILADETACFIVFSSDDGPDFTYVVNKDAISEAVFPCELS